MKYTRLICLLIAISVLFGFTSTCIADVVVPSGDENVLKLMQNLNIVEEGDQIDLTKNVSRANAVKYIVRMLMKVDNLPTTVTVFEDVAPTDKISGYLDCALKLNMIGEAQNFNPNDDAKFEEIVRMLIGGLGYGIIADSRGGFPLGFIIVASELGVAKGFSMGTGVTYGQMFVMLRKALLTKPYEVRFGSENYYVVSDKTLLEGMHKTIILKNAEISNENQDRNVLEIGSAVRMSLDIPSNYQNTELIDLKADVWYTVDTQQLIYLDISSYYSVKYDYITSFNGIYDPTAEFSANSINSVVLYSDNQEYQVDIGGAKVRYNGIEMDSGTIKPINAFARVVFTGDAISAIDIYTLAEGGLVTNVTPSRLLYKKGLLKSCYIDNMDHTRNIKAIVDGQTISWKRIPIDSVMDYYQSDSTIFIVASTRTVKGILEQAGTGELVIDNERYNTENPYGKLYYSLDGGLNYGESSFDELYNKEVTAYLDVFGRVRYIYGVKDSDESMIGIITSVERSAFGVGSINIYGTHNGVVGVKKYNLNLRKKSEVSQAELANVNDPDNAMFKFIFMNKEIVEVQNLDWLVCNAANKSATSELLKYYSEERIQKVINDPYVFATGSTMGRDNGLWRTNFHIINANGDSENLILNTYGFKFFAAYDTLGSFNPSILSLNDFRNCNLARMFVKVGFDKDNIDRTTADVMYILSNPRYVRSSWDVWGMVEGVSKLTDDRYRIRLLEPGSKIVDYIVTGNDIIGEVDRSVPKKGDVAWLSATGYFEKVNYNAMGEIISDEEAEELEESGDTVITDTTYNASGLARVMRTIDILNEPGLFSSNNHRISYIDNIYTIDGSLMFYKSDSGSLLPIHPIAPPDSTSVPSPYIVEGSSSYLMFDYDDFINGRYFTRTYDSLRTIKNSGVSEKLWIYSVGSGARYPKIIIVMP